MQGHTVGCLSGERVLDSLLIEVQHHSCEKCTSPFTGRLLPRKKEETMEIKLKCIACDEDAEYIYLCYSYCKTHKDEHQSRMLASLAKYAHCEEEKTVPPPVPADEITRRRALSRALTKLHGMIFR